MLGVCDSGLIFRSVAVRRKRIRSAYCYSNVRLSFTRVDCARSKRLTKVIITLPESLFLQLDRGIKLPPVGRSFRRQISVGRHPPRKPRVPEYADTTEFDRGFPNETKSRACHEDLSPVRNRNKIEN
jgi:hypothetical protein